MRLIDADALELRYEFGYDHYGILCVPYRDVNESIKKAKTVDAVPVIRCRDCKYKGWVQEPCHGKSIDYCRVWDCTLLNLETNFCSYGKRKNADENESR